MWTVDQIEKAIDEESIEWAEFFGVVDASEIEGRRQVMRANVAVGYFKPLERYLDTPPTNQREMGMSSKIAITRKVEAVDRFVAIKHQIDEMLAKLTAASGDHFDRNPDSINWTDVGTLSYVQEQLEEIGGFLNIK